MDLDPHVGEGISRSANHGTHVVADAWIGGTLPDGNGSNVRLARPGKHDGFGERVDAVGARDHVQGNLDVIDRGLMDIMSVYRDVISVQTRAEGALVNEEARDMVTDLARRSSPQSNIRRIDAVLFTRNQMMEFNATPILALESMMVSLRV